MRTFFKVMLYLLVFQLLIMGTLALAAPEAAARIWNFPPKDPALARVVGPPWLAWEGIFGALGLIAYLGAYRKEE